MIAENMITCIQVMTEGRSDFLISYCHPDIPLDLDPISFDYLKLDVDRMIPVSAPLPDGKPTFALPGDGNSEIPYLAYHSTSFLGHVVKVFLNRQRKSLHLVQCYEDALAEGLKAMALEGRGLTWLPESTIGDTIDAKKLVRAGPKDWDIPLEIRIYCSSNARRPAATSLWTFLQRAL
jgi:DNA-binding transcriptional LysR family regulator